MIREKRAVPLLLFNMKHHLRNTLIAFFALIFVLLITRFANAAGPSMNLPPGTVDATFNYPGPVSYWKITLSSVPSGYDVTNGIYVSWCCDQTHTINNGAMLSVNLYSSYDPLQPCRGGDPGWNKVNYVINNKQGTADDVQAAIWHYIDSNGGNQADPDVIAMEAAADAHPSFVPLPGQLVAVVVYQAGSQGTFIEVIVPAQLTVTSAYDSPTPISGLYASGTSITASVTPIVPGPTGTQYVCTGYIGSGSVGSGTGASVTFTITQDSSITWKWQTQYLLTVNSPYDTPNAGGWYDSGATAYATLSTGMVSGGAGIQYVFTTWSGDASGTGLTSIGITMNAPKTAAAIWTTQYYLTVATNPSGIGTVSGTGWYDQSQTVKLTAPINLGKYSLITMPFSWDADGISQGVANPITVTMNAPHTATAHYSSSISVGGEWVPMDKLQLLAPWATSAILMTILATSFVYVRRKRRSI
jgi:hypothetical protein